MLLFSHLTSKKNKKLKPTRTYFKFEGPCSVQEILHGRFFFNLTIHWKYLSDIHCSYTFIIPLSKLTVTKGRHTADLQEATLPSALVFSILPAVSTPCITDEEETTEGTWRHFSFKKPNRNNQDRRIGFWTIFDHDSHPSPFLSTYRGPEDAGVFCLTERDEFPPALIPWRAARCLSGPAAAQTSGLKDKTEDRGTKITQNVHMKHRCLFRLIKVLFLTLKPQKHLSVMRCLHAYLEQ